MLSLSAEEVSSGLRVCALLICWYTNPSEQCDGLRYDENVTYPELMMQHLAHCVLSDQHARDAKTCAPTATMKPKRARVAGLRYVVEIRYWKRNVINCEN